MQNIEDEEKFYEEGRTIGIPKDFKITETTSSPTSGGRNTFYDFPDSVYNLDSLIRYYKLNKAEGDILKTMTLNLGKRHQGTSKKREVEKGLHYAVDRMLGYGYTKTDILKQINLQLEREK